MNVAAIAFLFISATAVMVLPRKWAPIPLLASCCYMTLGQGVEVGPISLPVYRMVLAFGGLRVILRHESLAGGMNAVDKSVVAWAGWVVLASFFHEWKPGSGPVYAAGFVFNVTLVYFLTRTWCSDVGELLGVLRILAWLLVPVALAMSLEHTLERNIFGVFGGVSEGVYVRDGSIRAQGPFSHPILAGTVGAVCFPLMIGIFRRYRSSSIVGLSACTVIVIASHSSGPLMSLFMGVFATLLWIRRSWLRYLRWAAIGAYVSAEVLMTRPAYYLISKIDLTGSSTGWHRAKLIESAFQHLSEWWVFGTDYTGHWMPTWLSGDSQQADITNYYLYMGVIAGLPAMLLLIAMMWRAFVWVGESVRNAPAALREQRFIIWCLGAGLFAHAATSVSVAYFDQSMMFFWLNMGIISSMFSIVFLSANRKTLQDGLVDAPARRSMAMGAVGQEPRRP